MEIQILVLRNCFSRNNYIHKTLTRRRDVPHEAGFEEDIYEREMDFIGENELFH
ncbi:hypothetical protein IGI04_006189 [Brassica rapa subsp. trilocularis]|uniref:Uncharacterized protein n=1 Tax=Brassica rapa subsp. trilocularis TaxID=1813537 RepID=A0ABQ7NIJ8_BRACM|nr:hypothetical protein IGI04_006189 [Brassica rapa subsp. trilocularis]